MAQSLKKRNEVCMYNKEEKEMKKLTFWLIKTPGVTKNEGTVILEMTRLYNKEKIWNEASQK